LRPSLEPRQDTFESSATLERDTSLLCRKLLEGRIQIYPGAADLLQHRSRVREVWLPPGAHGASPQRKTRVGDRQLLREPTSSPEAVAPRAGTERRVEREQLGADLGNRGVPFKTSVAFRKSMPPTLLLTELDNTVTQLVSELDRLSETRADTLSYRQAVDHNVDRNARRQRPDIFEIDRRVVHAQPHEPLAAQVRDEALRNA